MLQIFGKSSISACFLNIFSAGKGTDVAGEVVEVGPGVKSFKVGDKVVAVISHAVRTHSYSFGLMFPSINNSYAILLSFLSYKFKLEPCPKFLVSWKLNPLLFFIFSK